MSKWFILTLCSVLMRLFSPAQSWPAYSVTVCDKQPSGYYFFQAIKTSGSGPAVHPTQTNRSPGNR